MNTNPPSGPRRQHQSQGGNRHRNQGKNRRPNSNGYRQNTGGNGSYNSPQGNQGQRQQQPRNSHGQQRNQQNGAAYQRTQGQQRNGNQHRQGPQQHSQPHHQGNHRQRNSNRQNQNQHHGPHPHQQHPRNMRHYDGEDELDWDAEDTDTTDDEVLEDAPPLESDQQNLNLNAIVERLRGFLGENLGQTPQRPGFVDRTAQGWFQQQLQQILGDKPQKRGPRKKNRQQQECQDECCQPSYTDDQWAQEHIMLCAAATLDWEMSQRQRLEEQGAAIYNLNHEAVKVLSVLEHAQNLQQQQQPQQQQQQAPQQAQPFTFSPPPLRFSPSAPPPQQPGPQQPPPQPQPLPPSQLTHSQKLETLLLYHSDLKAALHRSKELVASYEAALARNENRPARRAAISAFFRGVTRTVGRAESRLRTYHGTAARREANGGHFLWVGADETAFCAAWENVMGLYREVAAAEARLAASQSGADWEAYSGMLGLFADQVKGFEEMFLGQGFGA